MNLERRKDATIFLTKEDVLRKVSPLEIYRYYVGKDFKLDKAIRSPLRKDRNPSFVMGQDGDRIHHYDFVVKEHSGDCFDLVMQMFNMTFRQALIKIVNDFAVDGRQDREPVKYEERPKSEVLIQVKPRNFYKSELEYWGSYYQGLPELSTEKVFAVDKWYINRSEVPMSSNEMVFAYLYEDKYWKIYRPLETGSRKWVSNVPLKVADGVFDIPKCRSIIVTKSKKDKMCLKLLYPYTCSVQNESVHAFSVDTVTWLKGQSRGSIFVAFDSDIPGARASQEVCEEFGFTGIFPCEQKDFAEMVRVHGLSKVQECLKSLQVI